MAGVWWEFGQEDHLRKKKTHKFLKSDSHTLVWGVHPESGELVQEYWAPGRSPTPTQPGAGAPPPPGRTPKTGPSEGKGTSQSFFGAPCQNPNLDLSDPPPRAPRVARPKPTLPPIQG